MNSEIVIAKMRIKLLKKIELKNLEKKSVQSAVFRNSPFIRTLGLLRNFNRKSLNGDFDGRRVLKKHKFEHR